MPKLIHPCRFILALVLPGMIPASPIQAQVKDPDPASVVVVANAAAEGSVKVARAYMRRRDIPSENLVEVTAPSGNSVSRAEYVETIHNPVLAALIAKGLVEGLEVPADAHGRNSVAVLQDSVRYLVLCQGVPFIVKEAPSIPQEDVSYQRRHLTGGNASLVKTFAEGTMAKNEASVDGELALLLKRDVPVTGFVPNPLYNNKSPGGLQDILRVTRLDGPSPEAVIRMLDNSLQGEREGLKGRAYVDEDGRGGGFAVGNAWMAKAAGFFDKLGYDLSHDTKRETFRTDDRFDAPVLYAGWYAGHVNGPFTLPDFQFPAGAVAVHLHSFSASDLRSSSKGWVGPFVERGVSATLGNVREPYLALTHNLDLFFAALLDGWTFGDAAYLALPGLSWQAVAVGDPLYRPFKVSLEEQLEAVGHPARILEDQYVVSRKIHLLQQAGQVEEAIRLANRAMRETPGPSLGLLRARLLMENGRNEAAAKGLALFASLPADDPMDWGLLAEIADTLNAVGESSPALNIYRNLERQQMPEKVQLAFLKRGISVAQDAGQPGIATEWQTRVNPPKPPEPETRDLQP